MIMENNQDRQQVNKRKHNHGPKKALLSQLSVDSSEFLDDQTIPMSDSEGATPKHQRVDSLSMISIPDDLRLSFSGIEEESLQLDDLVSCMPSSGSGTPSSYLSGTDNKCDNDEADTPSLSSIISSSSDKKPNLTSAGNGVSSVRQNKTAGFSESAQDNSIYTWDDLMAWGTASSAQQVSTVGSSGEVVAKKKVISPRRSSKNKHMENVSCQVCSDIAAGFYCGAFICEACKKFYMRAYKQDKLKYVCLRDKKCIITKESRVQCQYCRFQKCVSLNMYIPKQGEGEMGKEMQMSEIPCRVCSAPSSGFHFGAITCEGCKGFFRRMAKERESDKYQCNKKGSCEVNMVTRNLCKACRYRACVRAGMSVEGSRIGRQPNSVKHAISMELKHQGKAEQGSDNASFTKIKEEPIDTSDCAPDQDGTDNYSAWHQPVTPSVSASENTTYNNKKLSGSEMSRNKSEYSANHVDMLDNIRQGDNPAVDVMPGNSAASTCVSSDIHSVYKSSSMSHDFTPSTTSHYTVHSNQYKDSVSLVVPQPNNVIQPHVSSGSSSSHTSIRKQPVNSPVIKQSTTFASQDYSQRMPETEHNGYDAFNIQKKRNENLVKPSSRHDRHEDKPVVHNLPVVKIPRHENEPVLQNVVKIPGQKSNEEMMEFIRKTIDAGKCLQLLNYRVFDTDVNPTTSMNVDDIKAMFKTKYMDPSAGNHITSKVDMSVFSTRESTWNYMMTNFHHNTYITIRFAKLVPGFKTLSLNDQVKLIQSSIYPIELLNMSKVFDPATKKYNYFTYTKEEENVMMEQFPMLRVFQEHFLHVGEMVTSFQFTDEEFAILSALLLFPAEVIGLENPKAVESLQTEISSALQYYEENTFPNGATRYGILLVRVAELVQCLLQHNLAIGLLLTHNPTIKVPQLFHELIIESIKEGQKS